MTPREMKRRARAARNHADRLEVAGMGRHTVKNDGHGFYYPIPVGTGKRHKGTSVPVAGQRTELQVITARGTGEHTKRKHTVRYKTGGKA